MKFLQQLSPLVETHIDAIENQLDESSVIRALDQFRKYTIHDIADFAFLHFLILFILSTDEKSKLAVRGHSARTIQLANFDKLTFVGTDLYVYLHLLLGHSTSKLKGDSKTFLRRCTLSEREVRSMLRDLSIGQYNRAKETRFLLMLEKQLQISSSTIRSWRRMSDIWELITPLNRRRILIGIRQVLSIRCPNSDLLPHLEEYLRDQRYMNNKSLTESQSHNSTRNQPFTAKEEARLNKVFADFERKGKTDLSAAEIGFFAEESSLPFWVKDEIYASANDTKDIQTHSVVTVSPSDIYAQDQDGVSVRNLKTVWDHWDKAPLPEILLLPNGKYWLIEGHHRISLQVLAGRKQFDAYETVDRVSKAKDPNA
jgi:hypothetical protein